MKINLRKIVITTLPTLFFLPILVFATNTVNPVFVNCDGTPANPCNFSNLIFMVNSLLTWFISIAFILAAIGLTWSGARIVMAAGKESELSAAKNMFWNIIKGVLFVAGAWLIVYTIMTELVNPNGSGNFLRFLR